jgi:hypothetical protein
MQFNTAVQEYTRQRIFKATTNTITTSTIYKAKTEKIDVSRNVFHEDNLQFK